MCEVKLEAADEAAMLTLGARIAEIRAAREPKPHVPDHYSQANLAWRMVTELVAGLAIGFGIGYGLDRLLGTLPVFLVLFTMLGLAAGIKVMLRTARELGDGSDGKAGDTPDAPDSGKRD